MCIKLCLLPGFGRRLAPATRSSPFNVPRAESIFSVKNHLYVAQNYLSRVAYPRRREEKKKKTITRHGGREKSLRVSGTKRIIMTHAAERKRERNQKVIIPLSMHSHRHIRSLKFNSLFSSSLITNFFPASSCVARCVRLTLSCV